MSEGYQRKIDSIVDKMIDGEKNFNNKSVEQQNKDKEDMSISISKSISGLNNFGQELVLNELDLRVSRNSVGVVDSTGNINISELTKLTATIVTSKMEEAKREGIDLRRNGPKENNDAKVVLESVVMISLIEKMNKDFSSLTKNEIDQFIDGYIELSYNVRKKFKEEFLKSVDDTAKEKMSPLFERVDNNIIIIDITKKLGFNIITDENIEEIVSKYKELQKQNPQQYSLEEEKIRQACQDSVGKTSNDLKNDSIKIMKQIGKENDKLTSIKNILKQNPHIDKITQENIEEIVFKYKKLQEQNPGKYTLSSDEIRSGCLDRIGKNLKEILNEIDRNEDKTNINFNEKEDNNSKQSNTEPPTIENIMNDINNTITNKNKLPEIYSGTKEQSYNIINDEISIFSDKLLEQGFSNEDINKALIEYSNLIKQIDDEVIKDYLKDKDNNELKMWMQELFQDKEGFPVSDNVGTILQGLASLDFDDKLQRILTSPILIQEELLPALMSEIQQLDQSIENTQESIEQTKFTQEEQAPITVDKESIRQELSAIPGALLNVEGIDKKDIASGMQGYKQLLDGLDKNELQGKSDDEVMKILMSKTSEIGLEGNANSILIMMSQIGFSNDGNRQIASILKESKEEFVSLVDEASKEENIDRAILQKNSQQEISDNEATPGIEALMVDLKFAGEKDNELENQVISGIDNEQVDINSDSDTDTTQGSTSSGKLKPNQIISGLLTNVKISDIKDAQNLVTEILKYQEKGDKALEEDKETLEV